MGRILPAGTQSSSFWIDESGSKNTAGKCFVLAGVKTRRPDDIQRSIKSIREAHGYTGEFKFSRITEVNIARFYELVDVLEASDAMLTATVIGAAYNPFKGTPAWEAHASTVSRLVIGSLNRNEIATVIMDGISTPTGTSLGQHVKRGINAHFHTTACVQAFSLDSKSSDLLQAADMVAGAIFNQRQVASGIASGSTAKAKVARRLASAFDLAELTDQRTKRVNIATLEPARQTNARSKGRLSVVK